MDAYRKKLLKKSAFFILIGLVATISVYSQQMTTGEARSPATEQAQKIRTDLRFPTNVQLDGDLARRIALTERRLQSHPFDLDFIVQDVARTEGKRRRFEEYEGDVSGRLLGAWSYISRLTDRHPARLDSVAAGVLQHQSPEGWFGIDQRGDNFDQWGRQNFGHGRLLVGLVQYYKLSGNPAAIIAAEKLGDYFVATIPGWTTAYEEHPWKKSGKIDWKSSTSNRLHFTWCARCRAADRRAFSGLWAVPLALLPEHPGWHSDAIPAHERGSLSGIAAACLLAGDRTAGRAGRWWHL